MSEKKLNELNEMEAADGDFSESESKEGLLNDETLTNAVGGILPKTSSPRIHKPSEDNSIR